MTEVTMAWQENQGDLLGLCLGLELLQPGRKGAMDTKQDPGRPQGVVTRFCTGPRPGRDRAGAG
jgi:hypothetical protein